MWERVRCCKECEVDGVSEADFARACAGGGENEKYDGLDLACRSEVAEVGDPGNWMF